MKKPGIENITKASHSASFMCNDIRDSFKHSTLTESIILEGLMKAAVEIRIRLERFETALAEKEE